MPLRMKEVHIVRQPFLFNMVWPMFKQFVGDKLKKRVCIIIYGIHVIIYNILRHRHTLNLVYDMMEIYCMRVAVLELFNDTNCDFERILFADKSITFFCH